MDKKEERRLLRTADRVSRGLMEHKQPEFAAIVSKLEELGYDLSSYYLKPGTRGNRVLLHGFPKSHFWSVFENFEVNDENRDAYDFALEYAENFDEMVANGNNLVFVGSNGTGKTHLAAALCRRVAYRIVRLRRDKSLYIEDPVDGKEFLERFPREAEAFKFVNANRWAAVMQDLVQDRIAGRTDERSPQQHAQELSEFKGLLILDEFLGTRDTEFCLDLLQRIISWRYDYKLPTLVITNRTEEEVRNLDNTTADRLFDTSRSYIVHMAGDSYRAK